MGVYLSMRSVCATRTSVSLYAATKQPNLGLLGPSVRLNVAGAFSLARAPLNRSVPPPAAAAAAIAAAAAARRRSRQK